MSNMKSIMACAVMAEIMPISSVITPNSPIANTMNNPYAVKGLLNGLM